MAYDRDLRDELEEFYTAEVGRIDIVDVPEMGHIAVTGVGDAASDDFQQCAEALIAVARAARQIVLERLGFTHVVPPLEALWAPNEGGDGLSWMLLIPQPDWVDRDTVTEALVRAELFEQWGARLGGIHYEVIAERSCVQTLHAGPLTEVGDVYEGLFRVVLPARGLQPSGLRHEIYLTNPRTTAPDEMRTILRQPVRSTVAPHVSTLGTPVPTSAR